MLILQVLVAVWPDVHAAMCLETHSSLHGCLSHGCNICGQCSLPYSFLAVCTHWFNAMCCRVWKGLVLAAFFNLQSKLYYELMGNFMGKGDKESFALGLSVAALPFELISTPVGSVGWNQGAFG